MAVDDDYPCRVCDKLVKSDDQAVLCDAFCDKWYQDQARCIKLSSESYKKIQALGDDVLKWFCDSCEVKLVKLRERKLAFDYIVDLAINVSDIMSSIIKLQAENAVLRNKMDSVINLHGAVTYVTNLLKLGIDFNLQWLQQ